MSRFFSLMVVVAIVSVVSWGCSSDTTPAASTTPATQDADGHAGHDHDGHEHASHDHEGHDHDGHEHATMNVSAKLCGGCGATKDSETCCSADVAKCDGCGKNKGSALCCVELDEAAAGKDLCSSCGHVAGSEACCADGAEKCACGMAKGSPLCCKLKPAEEE